jgi:hypothetical protein
MSVHRPTHLVIAASTAVLLAGGALAAANPASAHIRTAVAFGGAAYGSSGHLGTLFNTGRSARVPLCTTRPGVTHTDHTQESTVSKVGTLGAVHTKTSSNSSKNSIASISTARTAGTSLFAGQVTGTAFAVNAKASRSSSGYGLAGTTTLTDVKIFGRSAPTHPSVNQTLALPGIGSVVLNKQTRSHRFGMAQISVVAVQLTVAGNNTMGLPAGKVVISSARASLHEPTHYRASGVAFGTTVVAGDQVRSGKTAPVYLPCGGTGGATGHNQTGAVTASGLQASATHTTGRSVETASGTKARLTSRISGVNLLGGVVRARSLVSVASAARTNGHLTRSSAGTSIGSLTINGTSRSASAPANTKVSIPGVGTLWIHRVIRTAKGLQVYALQLVLNTDRSGLTKGTVISVAGSTVGIAKK